MFSIHRNNYSCSGGFHALVSQLPVWFLNSTTVGYDDTTISRLNWGVQFRHHMSLKVTQDIWRVTFQVPLPVFTYQTNSTILNLGLCLEKKLFHKDTIIYALNICQL